jgi:hypothetical protein
MPRRECLSCYMHVLCVPYALGSIVLDEGTLIEPQEMKMEVDCSECHIA